MIISERKRVFFLLPPRVDNGIDESEPVNGESMVKSKSSSLRNVTDWCDGFFVFIMGIFMRLPPNKFDGLVERRIGIVALEFNDVNES